jgi:exosortase A-associated hydrolase 2
VAPPAQADVFPLYLQSSARRLFAMAARPAGGPARIGLLVCPAFAEEMNRTRRTVRLLCGAAATAGACAIYPDLHGTGDSPGDFADARWADWLEDLSAAAGWLQAEGCGAVVLVGVRAGALLAWDLLRAGTVPVSQVVLWQPVLTGKAVVTDLLRTRIAAAASQSGRDTVATLRAQLAAGQVVESVGYGLSPELVRALDATAIAPLAGTAQPPVSWIEVIGDEASATRQPALAMVSQLQAAGGRVELLRQADPPFWSTVEITVGHGTIGRTTPLLAACA